MAACAVASLAIALGISFAAGYGAQHARDVLAGWSASIAVLIALHHVTRRNLRAAPEQTGPRQMVLAFLRLIILLILIVIVLVTAFFEVGPFLIGLFAAYFSGVWLEILWLAGRSASDRAPVSQTGPPPT
ncbi:MAG TPA: hypothetical protein PKE26_11240 [Kiritimatiellia bacterium]|nr:hypothetical protein [Kiritimatiellia bacterium]HMO99674.1 hypothetical protein [Kiritimatiellia bacterium]HMP96152.1 hypothetical protein [Kiritimatiellia bacterium]